MASERWQEDAATIAGRLLTWRRGGSGPTLLYLHDAGADTVHAAAFDDLRVDHDVVVLNLPGYAGSAPPAGLDGAADIAELLAQLCSHLTDQPVLAAGTSLGGWFAAELTLHAPHLVSALLLSDAAGLHAPADYLFALFSQGRAAAATQDLISDALLDRLPEGEQHVDQQPPAVAAAVAAPWIGNLAAAAAMSWHPYTVNPRLLGRLGQIRCPTTVLWGERDSLIPLEHARLFAGCIPGARLEVLRGIGHLPALEAPAAFAEAVRLLSRLAAARAGTVPG